MSRDDGPSREAEAKKSRPISKSDESQKSIQIFDTNVSLLETPRAYASFSAKFLHCNEIFADILGRSVEQVLALDILSIVKFDTFEGPQTASYTFDKLLSEATTSRTLSPSKASAKASTSDSSGAKVSYYTSGAKEASGIYPEFNWSAPLGMMRSGLIERKIEVKVVSSGTFYGGSYVLDVTLRIIDRSRARAASLTNTISFGRMSESDVRESWSVKKYRVFVVDNSSATLKTISKFISDTGHEVDTESDINAAIESLQSDRYDVVLMDLGLKGMSSLKIAHELRIFERLNRGLSKIILAMSSDFDNSMFTEAMNAGFDGFIAKPFNITDFLSIVVMLDQRRG